MSAGILVAGIFVTLIVSGAMGVLVWGLRMEARKNAQRSSSPRGNSSASESASEPRQS